MIEGKLRPDDFINADEVFITSSIREVVPVVQVDDRRIADGRPGPVVAQLHAAYREVVRAQTRREETGA